MAFPGGSDSSTDTEDETVLTLRARGVSNECIQKFKSTSKAISKRVRRDRIVGDFCTKCSTITVHNLRASFSISDSFHSLKQSAQTCKLCRLVLKSLRNKLPDIDVRLEDEESTSSNYQVTFLEDGGTDTAIDRYKITVSPRFPLLETFVLSMSQESDGIISVQAQISLKFNGRDHRQGLFGINSMIRIFTKDDLMGRKLLLPPDTRPKSQQKFDLIKDWLRQEKLSGAEIAFMLANPAARAGSFPTRLVHISSCSQIETCRMRLVDSSDLLQEEHVRSGMPYPPYITLSHRWGAEHHFTTIMSNISSRHSGFTFLELPTTYSDAVVVAYQLGFEYIWIDAICIVQDDPEEWKRESEKMGMIFRHAACTIASHCSDNDESGFLHAALRKRGSVDLSSCGQRDLYLRSAADLECDIASSPLSKRGWVLQERFLSTRILHFTTGMIYLETAQGIRSEDGEYRADLMQITVDSLNLLSVEHFLYRKPLTLQNFSVCLPQPTAHMPLSMNSTCPTETSLDWFSLLEMYSTCSLSLEQDKLAAISGIATICRQSTRASYLAGFWSDRLPVGLMWMNVGHPLQKANVDRAPSWSWAAYDGPTQFPLARFSQSYTTTCQLVRHDGSKGWLNGPGALTLRVNLLKLYPVMGQGGLLISLYREELYSVKSRAWDLGDHDSLVQADSIQFFNIFNARRMLWEQDGRHSRGDGSWIVLEDEEGLLGRQGRKGAELYCASLASFPMFCKVHKQTVQVHLVVLLVVVGHGPRLKFKRVGAGLLKQSFIDDVARYGWTQGHYLTFEDREIVII